MIRVLLVEDTPVHQLWVVRRLQADFPGQCEFIVCDSSAGAAKLLSEKPFDVVLLDLGLVDTQNAETLKAVRAATKLPIIVLSADSYEVSAEECFMLGAADYLTKDPPTPPEVMIRVMHREVAKHKAWERAKCASS